MTDLLGFEECPACGADEPFDSLEKDDDLPHALYSVCHDCELPAFVMVGYLPLKKGGKFRPVDPKKYQEDREMVA